MFGRSAEETGLIWKAISEVQSYVLPLAQQSRASFEADRSTWLTCRRPRADCMASSVAWSRRCPHAAGWPWSALTRQIWRFIRSSKRCCPPPARRRSDQWAWAFAAGRAMPGAGGLAPTCHDAAWIHADLSAALARNELKQVGVLGVPDRRSTTKTPSRGAAAQRSAKSPFTQGGNGSMTRQLGTELPLDGVLMAALSRRAVLEGAAATIAATAWGVWGAQSRTRRHALHLPCASGRPR